MDFIFRCPIALMSQLTQFIHLCIDPPLLRLPGGTVSRVFLPTLSWFRLFTCPDHLNLDFLQLSVIHSTFGLSLLLSFLAWSLCVWQHGYLPIFISVTSSFFKFEVVIGAKYKCNMLFLPDGLKKRMVRTAHSVNIEKRRWALYHTYTHEKYAQHKNMPSHTHTSAHLGYAFVLVCQCDPPSYG